MPVTVGAPVLRYVTPSAWPYTVMNGDIVRVDSDSAARTITGVTPTAGFRFGILDTGRNSLVNNITVARSVANKTFTDTDVNTSTEVITVTSHGYITGTPFTLTSTGTLPAPLATSTTYYAIYNTANSIKVASSLANALAGTAINLTTAGTAAATNTIVVSQAIDAYVGSLRLGYNGGYWEFLGDGTNWQIVTRPCSLAWMPSLSGGSTTLTTTPATISYGWRGEICPEGRNYYIEFSFDLGTVVGTPGAVILSVNGTTALDRVARDGTHTTLIAAATELCRWTKGSTLGAGNSQTIRTSSSYFIGAGERLGHAGTGTLFFGAVDSATSAVFISTCRMVPA